MARLTREQIEMSLLANVEKATKSNYAKEHKQATYLMQLLDTIEFETMTVMQTSEGHVNVGTLVECILKCMYNGEINPSYSSKGLKDISLVTTDENGKKHVKSYEVKTVLRNESSEVSANRLDLLVVSYNGINLLTRKHYNEIKNDLSIYKKDTHRLNRNVLKYCVEFWWKEAIVKLLLFFTSEPDARVVKDFTNITSRGIPKSILVKFSQSCPWRASDI